MGIKKGRGSDTDIDDDEEMRSSPPPEVKKKSKEKNESIDPIDPVEPIDAPIDGSKPEKTQMGTTDIAGRIGHEAPRGIHRQSKRP